MTPEPIPVKPAATVMLLRDTSHGIEVFMLRRTTRAAFAGGMYVFPGGKVDEADGDGDDGYVIAAIRECFEEAGVLLAKDETTGAWIADGHPALALAHRHAVHQGTADLRALCPEHHLSPAVDDLVWVSRWVTPVGESSRRFDTRFFIAVGPPGQSSVHDDNETIASTWIRPGDALQREANGELVMMPPTTKSLEYLAAHRTADEVMTAARRIERPTPIHPKMRRDETGRMTGVSLPGDDDYADLD
jgi:8-oxo-dGTP pyrophosphatase MutT (NUDIX family)